MSSGRQPEPDRFEHAAEALRNAHGDARANPVHGLQETLEESVGDRAGSTHTAGGGIAGATSSPAAASHIDRLEDAFAAETPAGACLLPFLTAIGWTGETRHLYEALPHFDDVDDVEALRAVLSRLNLGTIPREGAPGDIPAELLPCLFHMPGGAVYVLIEPDRGEGVLAYDGTARTFCYLGPRAPSGTAFAVAAESQRMEKAVKPGRPWFEDILSRFRSALIVLAVLSLVMNALSMLMPVYVMNVYDKVLGTRSLPTLISLLVGIIIAIIAEARLRKLRTEALAYLGGRFESLVSIGVVQQLLYMPVGMTESVSAGNQITRLKQFEGVRDAFSGPLGTAMLDLPFIVLFCAAVFVIGGPLGWIPVSMVAALLIMGALAAPASNRLVAKAGDARIRNRNALMELTHKHGTLREIAASDIWTERYKNVAAEHFNRQFQAQQFNTTIQTIGQSLVMISGVAAMFFGTHMVLAGELTVGGLIAIMALIWRVLSPLQAAFMSLNRLTQLVLSIRQINRMMQIPIERAPGKLPTIFRELKGSVDISQVSFRYTSRGEPVLRGVSLAVKPGELVAITGGSGAGKSSLLKIVAGLYKPQGGVVFVDGLDLRQIDVGELRASIGFAPQFSNFFYGTILQNLQLAHPTLTREEALSVLEDLGAGDVVRRLPDGLDTRLNGETVGALDDSFRQQLSLARAFIKQAPLFLLDEPGGNLDRAADEALISYLDAQRGKATVMMVTHRPSHMRLADRLLVMRQGQIVADGDPEEVLAAMSAAAA